MKRVFIGLNIVPFIALLWGLYVLSVSYGVYAQGENPAPPISPELLENIEALEDSVEAIRGLQPQTPVMRYFPTREEAIAYFTAAYEAELTDEVVFKETQFYRAFDFVGDDFDLETLYISLISDQVAGYYDSETKEMNTILFSGRALGDDLPALEQMIYAHEYTHALQDQYFDLEGLLSDDIIESDQVLAMLSLIEGDATYVMQEFMVDYLAENPGAMLQILGFSLSGAADIPEGTPPILEAELTAPYLDGMTFVMALLREDGWQAVNDAFANPPVSMEQIYHPEKYLSGEAPMPVELTPADDLFEGGWTPVMERSLGEFYLRQYLATQLTSQQAQNAAQGWGGDRFRLYYNENADEHAWVLRILWDNVEEGSEFLSLYKTFLNMRLGDDHIYATEFVGECWEDTETLESICFFAQAGESIIAYAPTLNLATELIARQRA